MARTYRRDAKGRFTSTGTAQSPEAARRKRRRRAVVAGSTALAGAVAVSQARNPASHARAAITRRQLVNAHVARAASDHRRTITRRARALPHKPTAGAAFPKAARKAAKAEGRKLTRSYRRQAKRSRTRRRQSR
jgi:hypothetical protein